VNVIMLGGPLIYCALLFSFDFYLMGSSIYVYMSDLVGRIATQRFLIKEHNRMQSLKIFDTVIFRSVDYNQFG
jgi:hypothetical protein